MLEMGIVTPAHSIKIFEVNNLFHSIDHPRPLQQIYTTPYNTLIDEGMMMSTLYYTIQHAH
jgi:hypothetical protein